EILRIEKGRSLNKIIHKINNRLSSTYNRRIKTIPEDVINGEKLIIKDKLLEKSEVEKNNDMLKIGDKVFVKNFKADKLDYQYLGPVTIKKIGKKRKWVKVSRVNSWIHVKNIKFWK
ncbi:hypothetical protein H311_05208, partial [Anncaliia algerae PRA109]